MSQPLLLSGEQEYVEPKSELDRAFAELREDLDQQAQRIANLEHTLAIVRSGFAVAAGDVVVGAVGNVPAQFDHKWEAWKQKLGVGTAPARVIDALLTHGPLNRTQLRQVGELGWSTLDAATSRLKNLSLIEKIGDRWNLKTS